jgi:hypothetical protein
LPQKNEHLDKSLATEKLARSLDLQEAVNVDWVIIMLFYAALHYIEAYFAQSGMHSRDHKQRDSSINGDPKLRPIYKEYGSMKAYSINARYFVQTFTPSDVAKVNGKFAAIKTHVTSLLS